MGEGRRGAGSRRAGDVVTVGAGLEGVGRGVAAGAVALVADMGLGGGGRCAGESRRRSGSRAVTEIWHRGDRPIWKSLEYYFYALHFNH